LWKAIRIYYNNKNILLALDFILAIMYNPFCALRLALCTNIEMWLNLGTFPSAAGGRCSEEKGVAQ
jgi:hypothetical protein